MKHYLFLTALAPMLLSVSQESFPTTRTTEPVETGMTVKSINLSFFDSDGTEQYQFTKLRSEATSF